MNYLHRIQVVAIATCVSCLTAFSAPESSTAILVKDTFSLTETRKAGDSLQGLAPEIGSGTWNVQESSGNANALFSPNGTIISKATGNNLIEARIGIDPTGSSLLTVTSTFVNATTDWVGIGFLTSTSFGNGWNGNGNLLTVYLRENGTWQISSNKNTSTRTVILSESIADFDSDSPYTLSLSFDPGNLQASLSWFNTTTSGSTGWIDSGLSTALANQISAAGFRANPASGSVSGDYYIEDFEVTSVIPEPRNVALLIGALCVVCIGFKRRNSSKR